MQGRSHAGATAVVGTEESSNGRQQVQQQIRPQQQSKVDRVQLEALRQMRQHQQLAALQAANTSKRKSLGRSSSAARPAGHTQQQLQGVADSASGKGSGYAAQARAASPGRRSLGEGMPALATATRVRVSGSGSGTPRARSSSPTRHSSSGLEGSFSSNASGRKSLGGSYAAQARGSSPARRSIGADVPAALPARCRSESPARGVHAGKAPPAAAGSGGAEHKKVGEYDRPWRQNMKPVSTPSPAQVNAAAAAAAVSKPSAAAAAASPAQADMAAAAAVASLHALGTEGGAPGQPFVLKSKRRSAEEQAALQVRRTCGVWP